LSEPDVFFSVDDGLGESRHVYLRGNRLPEAWAGRDEFVVSELGFGTGLNLLALARLLRVERDEGRRVPHVLYQTVEWQPRPASDFAVHAAQWPELAQAAADLGAVYRPQPGWNRWTWPWGTVVLFVGDARALAAEQPSFVPADAWFLDGYSPDRGPELWEPGLLAWVHGRTKPGGTAATYSAAGVVKRGLREAGFTVERALGWGQKRHMVVAQR
jgi:tRNA 5-methylaminomethyl-2-thiouridine biosynthesis bifunctional protein